MNEWIDVPFEVKAKDVTPEGIFKGRASTFNGDPDSYGDIINPGAFTDTLKNDGWEGRGVAMLWQHRSDQPIGVWTGLEENQQALNVTGQLVLGVRQADDAYKLMRAGAIRGLSIGFKAREHEPHPKKKDVRVLKSVDLMEISLVTFPANKRALITGVKSVRAVEEILRDAGFSRSEAKRLISVCRHGDACDADCQRVDDQPGRDEPQLDLSPLLMELRRANAGLTVARLMSPFENQ